MQTISCTWPSVVPIGEDPAAHGHWCAFTDLYHTIPYTTHFVHALVSRAFGGASKVLEIPLLDVNSWGLFCQLFTRHHGVELLWPDLPVAIQVHLPRETHSINY